MACLALSFSKAFDSLKGLIIGIMETVRAVDRCAAKENNIIAFDFKIYVLESNQIGIAVAHIVNIADDFPYGQIVGYHQAEQISREAKTFGRDSGSDGIVFS